MNNTYQVDERGNQVHCTAIIYPGVTLGHNNYIGPYCIIGAPPEKRKCEELPQGVVIGNDNRLTGMLTIDAGSERPTIIGNRCYLMKQTHIGHDCVLSDDITMAPGTHLAGFVRVMKGADFKLNTAVANRHLIGPYAMLGMGCIVPKSKAVMPFTKYIGVAKPLGRNDKGMDKALLGPADIAAWEYEYVNQKASNANDA